MVNISLNETLQSRIAFTRIGPKRIAGVALLTYLRHDPFIAATFLHELEDRVKEMLHSFAFKTRRYIANLGHGICPDVEPEKVAAFVDLVHRYSADGIAA
ncbi:unnamed protein product [Hydatigera taeniaeformis]|uniref:Uroporphyrinogen_deCOase domain-containing protein n=1 Tax=Hydatigena taeniaeformis TaxID=6205 RepID=A0A0R3WJL3_HYDTA|nr:unnamed protein product [Hydatigera taeniaeformis]